MGRRRDPRRKEQMLGAIADYILENGLADLSLRPLAAGVGSNPRMLLYYFESRENLIVAAMNEVWRRQFEMLAEQYRQGGVAGGPSEMLQIYWDAYTAPKREPFLRLMFEIWGLALQNPRLYASFFETLAGFLDGFQQGLVRRGLTIEHAVPLATYYLATLRGLMLDLATTRDRPRIDVAIAKLVRDLEAEIQRNL